MLNRVYWDTFSDAADADRLIHAIWPSPIDSDACFADAGFTEFADTDDEWFEDWSRTIAGAVRFLRKFGEPVIRCPIVAVRGDQQPIWRRLTGRFIPTELPLEQQIELTTYDDQFPDAVVDFGPDVSLQSGAGHPILWIITSRSVVVGPDELIRRLGLSCPIEQRTLHWSRLFYHAQPGE